MIKKKRLGPSIVEELSSIKNPRKKSEILRSFLVESQLNVNSKNSNEKSCYSLYQDRANFKGKKRSQDNLDADREAAQLKSKIGHKVRNVDYRETTGEVCRDKITSKDWQWWKNELLEKHLKGVKKRSKENYVEDRDCKLDKMKEHFKPKDPTLMRCKEQENTHTIRSRSQMCKPTPSKSSRRVEMTLNMKSKHRNTKNVNMETHEKVNDKRLKDYDPQRQANVADENIIPNKFNSGDIPKRIPSRNEDNTKYKAKNMKRGPQESSDFYNKREGLKRNPNIPHQNRREPKPNLNSSPPDSAPTAEEVTTAYNHGIAQGDSDDINNRSRSNHVREVISVNHLVKLDQSVLSHIDKNRELEEYARHLKSKWGQSVPFREMGRSGNETDCSRGGDAVKYLYIYDADKKGLRDKSNNRTSESKFTAKRYPDPRATNPEDLKSLKSGPEDVYRTQNSPDWSAISAQQSRMSHHTRHPMEEDVQNISGQRNRYHTHRSILTFKQEPSIVNRCESIQIYPINKADPCSSALETPRKYEVQVKSSYISQQPRRLNSSARTARSTDTIEPYYNKKKSQCSATYERNMPPTRSTYQDSLYSRMSEAHAHSVRIKNSSESQAYTESLTPTDELSRNSSNPTIEQGLLTYDKWENDSSFQRSTKSCYLMSLQTSVYAGEQHGPQSSTDTARREKKLSPHLEQLIENVKSIGEQYYKFSSRTMIPVLRQVQNNVICRFCNLRQYLQTYVESLERSAQEYVESHEAKRRRVSVSPQSQGGEKNYPRSLPCGCKILAPPRAMCCCNMMCCNRCACNMCMCYYNRNRT